MTKATAATATATVKTIPGSVILGFDLCSDAKGKPLCGCATTGFRCQALRPKTYNARGDLVHYCGLAEPGQLPLLETSVKHGIVRPRKNKCWLRNHAPRFTDRVTHGTHSVRGTQHAQSVLHTPTDRTSRPASTLHQLGYVMATHIYLDNREFSGADITAMESDFECVRSALNIQRVQTDVRCLIRELCGLMNPSYTKWKELWYHRMMIEHSNFNNPGLRITPVRAYGYLCKSPCETSNGLVYGCTVLRAGGIRLKTIRK